MIWSREIEGGNFATPERRAALEARIGELANSVRDDVVRRYYREDLIQRLQRTFAPEPVRFPGRGNFRESPRFQPRTGGPFQKRGFAQPPAVGPGPYQATSPQLANSPIMRGQRSTFSRREALILQCLINHPWLLHEHLEEAAALELAHPEAHKLRAAIIAAFAHDHHHGEGAEEASEKMRADLQAAGFSQILQRVDRSITTSAVWGARSGAARDDVLSTWHQLVVLHQKTHALLREKKDAEVALGEQPSDANMAWLRDVSLRLESLEGTEAQIEGFGELSGRFQKSM
jgi:DNA primase